MKKRKEVLRVFSLAFVNSQTIGALATELISQCITVPFIPRHEISGIVIKEVRFIRNDFVI
jgi:hypothetical protein